MTENTYKLELAELQSQIIDLKDNLLVTVDGFNDKNSFLEYKYNLNIRHIEILEKKIKELQTLIQYSKYIMIGGFVFTGVLFTGLCIIYHV